MLIGASQSALLHPPLVVIQFGVASSATPFFFCVFINQRYPLDKRPGGQYVDIMFDPKLIDDISKRLAGSFPAGLTVLQDDFRRNLSSALQVALARLDLVTREEFEVQQAVLGRTRQKLEALEARVAELEAIHLGRGTG